MIRLSNLIFNAIKPVLRIAKERSFIPSDLDQFTVSNETSPENIEIMLQSTQQAVAAKTPLRRAICQSLFRVNRAYSIKLTILVFVNVMFCLGSPALMRFFLISLAHYSPGTHGAQTRVFGALASLVLVTLSAWLIQNQVFNFAMQFGVRVRTNLVDATLGKLKRSGKEFECFTESSLVSLLTRDIAIVQKGTEALPVLLLCSLLVVAALLMLYSFIGLPSLLGLVVLVGLLGASQLLVKRVGNLSGELSEAAKKRYALLGFFFDHFSTLRTRDWAGNIVDKIIEARTSESRILAALFRQMTKSFVIFFSTPILVTLAIFSSVALLTGTLQAEVLFPAIAIIGILRSAFYNLPDTLFSLVRAYEALERFGEIFCKATVFAGSDEIAITGLETVDVDFAKPCMIALVGPNGGGKSTLLRLITQKIESGRSIGFLPQVPLVSEGSIASNIMLGLPVNPPRMQHALQKTRLDYDLKQLSSDAQYPIFQSGDNLSGGQRQRLALAKLIFAEPDVLLLDDPLSSQDPTIADAIFTDLQEEWKERVVIFTTSRLAEARKADRIIVVADHNIVSHGTPAQLSAESSGFLGQWQDQVQAQSGQDSGLNHNEAAIASSGGAPTQDILPVAYSKTGDHLHGLSWRHFLKVLAQPAGVLFILGMFALRELVAVGGDLWLSSATLHPNMTRGESFEFVLWWACIAFGATMMTAVSASILLKTVLKATNELQKRLLFKVLNANLTFVESVPKAQHLSRFIYDQRVIDETLGPLLAEFLASSCALLAGLGLITFKMPALWLGLLPLMILYFFYQRIYRRTNRMIGVLESEINEKLLARIKEGVSNLWVLSHLGQEDVSLRAISRTNHRVSTAHAVSTKLELWFSVRVEEIGAVLYCGSAIVIAYYWHQGLPFDAQSGIVLGYASALTAHYGRCVRMLSSFEKSLSSVGQFALYEKVESMRQSEQLQAIAPTPAQGCTIEAKNIGFSYPSSAVAALKNISFIIRPGERVGIVGRTGSGKSSLTKILVGLYDATDGVLLRDHRDQRDMSPQTLARTTFYLPQRPTFLPGLLRDTLAPKACSDDKISQALGRFGVREVVEALPNGLDYSIADDGNLPVSIGTAQAILLASALLHTAQIVILDESTSSMDTTSEELAIATLRSQLAETTTLLMVTHRTHILRDFDTVISMELGSASVIKNQIFSTNKTP